MNDSKSKVIAIVVISIAMFIAVVAATIGVTSTNNGQGNSGTTQNGQEIPKGEELDALLKRVSIETATPVKASINIAENSLYDELPEIEK